MRGLSLVVASGGHSSSQCAGLSLSWPLLLWSTGSRHAGSVIVAHGPSCSAACGIFPDQGSNPCPLHWQADSQPLRHQGSPPFEPFLSVQFNGIKYIHIIEYLLPLFISTNFTSSQTETLNTLNDNFLFSASPAPENYHSTFCLYEFDYSRYPI